ncbi:unnamed protein product, partial [marine sediment metagenome]
MIMKFFEEPTGKSITRVMFVVGVSWSMAITTLLTISMGWSAGEFIAVFTATSGIFIGLKLGQKPMEKSDEHKIEVDEKFSLLLS